MQRNRQYGGVAEKDYPAWMCRVMAGLKPKLAPDGSVLIVIRSHVRNGVVSDYVLRTRLALREDGWKENEELIWLKPDAPPLGSLQRLRRTWEHILFLSKTAKPFLNLNASGTFSDRIGFVGSHRFKNGTNPIATKRPSSLQNGQSRTPDVFTAYVSEIQNGIQHPAMFPATLCDKLIRTFSREGDLVCDPFCGSGTTLIAARNVGRRFIGFDLNPKYVEIAKGRLQLGRETSATAGLRLRPDFPQSDHQRKAYLLSKGLNLSDVRVMNLIVEKTVGSAQRMPTVALSLSEVAELTGVSRPTAIRSLRRLQDVGLVQRIRHKEWHRRNRSMLGLAADLLLPSEH
jgi:site-specific DNA-methyltransferase (adenine-specific)/site-specific DNA-methyltransferase (cytosine-N4-specific)